MEKCHPYLISLNRNYLTEDECEKINALYNCGVERGFLNNDEEDFEDIEDIEDIEDEEGFEGFKNVEDTIEKPEDSFFDDCEDELCGGPEDSLTKQELQTVDIPCDNTPCFTIIYSAIKNNEDKRGEYFSNATSKQEAKNDCLEQLGNVGYNNIKIIAIEQNKDGVNPNPTDLSTPERDISSKLYEDDSDEYEAQETEPLPNEEPELSIDEKNALTTEYTEMFKDLLEETNLEKSFSMMTLEEKIDFLTTIKEKWSKNDPSEFLDIDEQHKLNDFIPDENNDSDVDDTEINDTETEMDDDDDESSNDEDSDIDSDVDSDETSSNDITIPDEDTNDDGDTPEEVEDNSSEDTEDTDDTDDTEDDDK
jgi:hypothetical protein